MLNYLQQFEEFFGPFRLFQYITFRAVLAGGTSLMLGFLIGPWIFRNLRRLNASQAFRDQEEVGELAGLHESKQSTPTMGGLMIFTAVLVSSLLWANPNVYVVSALAVYAILTAAGFLDDYLKVTRKDSGGLAGRWKLVLQALATVVAIVILSSGFGDALGSPDKMKELWVPFWKGPLVEQMSMVAVFAFFFLVLCGSSNAINLTDGLDGLAIGCTVTVALAFGIMAYVSGHAQIAQYLSVSWVPGTGELTVVCSALLGGGLAFLWFNAHPAEVFMGDTGSLGIGGLIGIIAVLVHQPFTLIVVGGIFVWEAISVILQVASFKMTGKRIFRMSPIHHHFELKGWHENKVVIRFWILSLVFAIAGLATLKLR
ncbi:MAG: phospho-N-acetylmuramoyl-pentapeptide-transferase [Opitutales bacterium]|nr:phospho-N-acetylmuramoyl-pentapeptide-transferase [Opitutales bacterium]|tara:strand:- start:1349 stop:2461 length:1113 start_codon:yes stop_codon:yes gene_type:complete